MNLGQKAFDLASEQVGTVFKHQGRKPKIGLDCLGLVMHIAHEMGFSPEDNVTYRRVPDSKAILEGVNKHLLSASVDDIHTGDVVLFHWGRKEQPMHFGVASGDGFFIHAYEPAHSVCLTRFDEMWAERVHSVHRFPGS